MRDFREPTEDYKRFLQERIDQLPDIPDSVVDWVRTHANWDAVFHLSASRVIRDVPELRVYEDDEDLIEHLNSRGGAPVSWTDTGNGFTTHVWAGRWAISAFPVVEVVSNRIAASFCCTTLPDEAIEFVREPWNAFLIRIPSGLLDIDGEPVERLQVRRHPIKGKFVWSYTLVGASGIDLAREQVPHSEMCQNIPEEELEHHRSLPHEMDMSPQNWRKLEMAAKIIIGVCMSFDAGDGGGVQKVSGLHRIRKSPIPLTNQYQIRRPIAIDAVPSVREYIEGRAGKRRGPVTTQTLVRGHWKVQRHGASRMLTKTIHIEPYWRGLETSPIAIGKHIIVGSQA